MTELFRVTAEITIPARDQYEAVQRLEQALSAVPAIQSFTIPRMWETEQAESLRERRPRETDCRRGHTHRTLSDAINCNMARQSHVNACADGTCRHERGAL